MAAMVAWIVPSPARGETPQTSSLSIEDALKVRSIGQLMAVQFSPNGKSLVYTIQDNQRAGSVSLELYARHGVPEWALGTDIHILNITTGETRTLTGGRADNWSPVWSPDGHRLAFISDRDSNGHARLWQWDQESDQLSQLSDLEIRTDKIEWTPDSNGILLTAVPRDLSVEEYAKRVTLGREVQQSVHKSEGLRVAVYQSSSTVSTDNDAELPTAWTLDRSLRDLYVVEVSSGKVDTIVQNKKIESFSLSPDGRRMAYSSPTRFEKPGSQQVLFDLITVDLKTKRERVVYSGFRFDYDGASFSWSPDSAHLGFQAGGMEEKTFDCYIADVQGSSPRNVTVFSQPARIRRKSMSPLWDSKYYVYFTRDGAVWRTSVAGDVAEVAELPNREIRQLIPQSGRLLWSPDNGKSVLVMAHDNWGKQDGVYKIDLTGGEAEKLLERGQCYSCANTQEHFTVSHDGQDVAFLAEDAGHDEDLWISDATFAKPRRVTNINPQLEKYEMGTARLISWMSDDGERLQGTLLLPAKYQEGKRYPLVVWVYGGTSLSDNFDRFGLGYPGPFNMQLFATRGYAVLAPDSPQHLGTPMLDLVKTVLPGVSKVVEMGVAAPDRIGVMGHSNGGFSTLGLIVQTNRFKAAMEVDGPGNLMGLYGEMDDSGASFGSSLLEYGLDGLGGTPWQFRQRYIENSPVFYLDRVATPLLIVHGAEDRSVAPFLGDEIFVALRRLHKEVEYAKYPGEGHSPIYWSYPSQVDLCNRMITWFGKYLENETSQEGPSP